MTNTKQRLDSLMSLLQRGYYFDAVRNAWKRAALEREALRLENNKLQKVVHQLHETLDVKDAVAQTWKEVADSRAQDVTDLELKLYVTTQNLQRLQAGISSESERPLVYRLRSEIETLKAQRVVLRRALIQIDNTALGALQ